MYTNFLLYIIDYLNFYCEKKQIETNNLRILLYFVYHNFILRIISLEPTLAPADRNKEKQGINSTINDSIVFTKYKIYVVIKESANILD